MLFSGKMRKKTENYYTLKSGSLIFSLFENYTPLYQKNKNFSLNFWDLWIKWHILELLELQRYEDASCCETFVDMRTKSITDLDTLIDKHNRHYPRLSIAFVRC